MLSSVFSFNMEKLNMESIQIYCTIMPTVNMKKLLWNIIFWQSLIIFATKLCFELSVVSKRTYNMPSNRVFFCRLCTTYPCVSSFSYQQMVFSLLYHVLRSSSHD
jgi:hypothetical protein